MSPLSHASLSAVALLCLVLIAVPTAASALTVTGISPAEGYLGTVFLRSLRDRVHRRHPGRPCGRRHRDRGDGRDRHHSGPAPLHLRDPARRRYRLLHPRRQELPDRLRLQNRRLQGRRADARRHGGVPEPCGPRRDALHRLRPRDRSLERRRGPHLRPRLQHDDRRDGRDLHQFDRDPVRPGHPGRCPSRPLLRLRHDIDGYRVPHG